MGMLFGALPIMPSLLGSDAAPYLLRISHGEKTTHLRLPRAILLSLAIIAPVMLALAATGAAWMIWRDEALQYLLVRQAHQQLDYEDRIASLRRQVDRVMSRQLLDQNTIEGRVHDLLSRQARLESRATMISSLADQVGSIPAAAPAPIQNIAPLPPARKGTPPSRAPVTQAPLPQPTPDEIAPTETTPSNKPRPDGIELRTKLDRESDLPRQMLQDDGAPMGERLNVLARSLDKIERDQVDAIGRVAVVARVQSQRLRSVLNDTGLSPERLDRVPMGTGGPFVPLKMDPNGSSFERALHRASGDFLLIARLTSAVRNLPLERPLQGGDLSSNFGTRIDPFFGRPAFHAGVDLRDEAGSPVRATAPGKVVTAGWAGGYGNMVEIEHANGISTRYGHMSAINVSEGQMVQRGSMIGRVGSTGRSTGPHLHYEVRVDGEPTDPMRFLRAGSKLQQH
jgi:murein DD-endopeptidase MepM/ murein hydrolase activator NlpD